MNCSRTKGLFSEYIDGQLDKEQEAIVKDHLLLCGDCRDEFESMKAVVREMGSLDTIKAPDDFLVSLHGRIKGDSWFQKVKAFLFIPARIRIPVELATLATAVVVGFFIFHIVPPVMPPKTPPETPSKMHSKSQAGLKDEKPEAGTQSNENAPAGAGIKPSETKAVSDKVMPEPRKRQELLKQDYQRSEPASVQGTVKISEPLQIVLALKPVSEKESVSQGKKDDAVLYQEKPEEKEADKAAPARFKTQAMPRMAESMGKVEAPAGEKLKKSYEEEVKPLSYQEGPLLNIEEHIRIAGGRILKTDINKETGQPEYLLIEISGQNYQKLVEKLGESGKIQTPLAVDISQFKQPIQVRLHILINK